MPHRGRLNLLTGVLQLPPVKLFHKLAGNSEFPPSAKATGDVISHLITSIDIELSGNEIHVTTLYNPSHLEAVNPVSMGKTRSRHLSYKQGGYGNKYWGEEIVNIQVHGDGAVMGQGINQESVLMSNLPFFQVGGSIHLIVNNQLAFTTPPEHGRGTLYASDIAKIISAPVIHVNGDSPKDVAKATRLAIKYQRNFRKDIFIDMNCYRFWGHNELDDPNFTNPIIYKVIKNRKTVPDKYAETLLKEGKISEEEIKQIVSEHTSWLNSQLKKVDSYQPEEEYLKRQWTGYSQAPNAITTWNTGVQIDLLQHIGHKSVSVPENFNLHPTILKSHIQSRQKKLSENLSLDWSTCEALAFGSLLLQGFNIRISGQDVGRGTFSHRHAMLVDQDTGEVYIPLNNMSEEQEKKLEIANSFLSEEAVLGFEYGMSIENPKNLVIWEAQFGDFFNGAQIQIDTFITSGETKWMQLSGLVMLLPHGYDGAGPEHSSCRIERFLQLSDSSETHPDGEDVNMHIANPTTPAQYFHLLRRQMIRNYRKPLIVVAPKTLLRLPEATSPLTAIQPGTSFQPILDDTWAIDKEKVKKVIFTSGKHYYNLSKYREESMIKDTAIIRFEELCPFPLLYIQNIITKYNRARAFVWSQEEPQNMGAWSYIKPRFENLAGRKIKYCGRKPIAAPAVGIGKIHKEEAEYVITQPFQMK
ncbi:putative 2-oxoadipate dehydrogenase complex component E1 homolog isoform X2 [Lycorma delicatula]